MARVCSNSWTKFLNCLWNRLPSLGPRETDAPVAFFLFIGLSAFLILDLYLFMLLDGIPEGKTLPITLNATLEPCDVSPYCYLSVKYLCLGQMDVYIHKPVAVYLNQILHLYEYFSANFISAFHIVLSIVSAKLIAHDSLSVRRIGFVMFELRNMCDALDGAIARVQNPKTQGATYQAYIDENKRIRRPTKLTLHTTSHTALAGDDDLRSYYGIGKVIDGICDGIGCIFLMCACAIYLQRRSRIRTKPAIPYSPLTSVAVTNCGCGSSCSSSKCSGESTRKKEKQEDEDTSEGEDVCPYQSELSFSPYLHRYFCGKLLNSAKVIVNTTAKCLMRKGRTLLAALIGGPGFPAFLILVQLLLSSFFWNRNMYLYTNFLEHPKTSRQEYVAAKVIHSPNLWVIIFLWRVINPLSMTEVILFAIFFDRLVDLLNVFQYFGFIIISFVAAISELYRITLFYR